MDWNDDEFAVIFEEIYPGLCRFLECLLGRHNAAEDVAQSAFLQLCRFGPVNLPHEEARFWLFRVARNLALNEIDKHKTRQRLWQQIEEMFQTYKANPAQELEQREQGMRLLRLLQTLPEHQRASLLLREQSEMSYREIARVLGITESKVKVDIFRARCALRGRWKN
ncbi:MAG TPA: sigma-70 family RNA polymerase sigma factor [Pyrinomonadaceae bacterium]|nr:sigma-70 family RNA polymerase sigma factor [Pyrinomonadaceae bacterium]